MTHIETVLIYYEFWNQQYVKHGGRHLFFFLKSPLGCLLAFIYWAGTHKPTFTLYKFDQYFQNTISSTATGFTLRNNYTIYPLRIRVAKGPLIYKIHEIHVRRGTCYIIEAEWRIYASVS